MKTAHGVLGVATAALLALTGVARDAAARAPVAAPSAAASAAASVAVTKPVSHATTEIALASLPQGQLLDQDWANRPAALPPGGKVAGVTLHREMQNYGVRSQPIIEISEAHVKGMDGDGDDDVARPDSLCFDTANAPTNSWGQRVRRGRGSVITVTQDVDDEPLDQWQGGMTMRTQLMRSEDGKGHFVLKDRVQLLHVEQLVTKDGTPALESRDVWVDAETGGARLRATARLPLRDLGEMPIGLHLYGGRVGDEVVFLATQLPTAQSLFAVRKDQGAQMTNCGHLAVRLDVKRGMSEMASFETMLSIPDVEVPSADVVSVKDGESVAFLNGKARSANVPVQTTSSRKTRLGQVFFSTSWEPGDSAPLLSYSESWGNRLHAE